MPHPHFLVPDRMTEHEGGVGYYPWTVKCMT